jgi:signal transduction histidine kinase
MFNLEDDDRRRLARELYDTIAQDAVALIMDLVQVIDKYPSEVRADFSEYLSLARQHLQDIQFMVLSFAGAAWSVPSWVVNRPYEMETGIRSIQERVQRLGGQIALHADASSWVVLNGGALSNDAQYPHC